MGGSQGAVRRSLSHPAPNQRLHLTPGSGVRWLGTTSVAPAQVKRSVRRMKRFARQSDGKILMRIRICLRARGTGNETSKCACLEFFRRRA